MLVGRPHHRLIATPPTHHHRQHSHSDSAPSKEGRGRVLGPPAVRACRRDRAAPSGHTAPRSAHGSSPTALPAPTHRQQADRQVAWAKGRGLAGSVVAVGPASCLLLDSEDLLADFSSLQSRTAGCRGCDGHIGHRLIPQQVVAVTAHVHACRPSQQPVHDRGSEDRLQWMGGGRMMAEWQAGSSPMLEAV